MKINDMQIGENRSNYFIWYYDNSRAMWCPYVSEKGFQYFTDDYLQYHISNARKLSNDVKVFRQTTERVE